MPALKLLFPEATSAMDLAGKVAIVTGAARGIGRGIVTELARAGCNVLIGDRLDLEPVAADAKQTLAQIVALGRRGAVFARQVARGSGVDVMLFGAAGRLYLFRN